MAVHDLALGEERVGPDEPAQIDELVGLLVSAVAKKGELKRGQHEKHHGLVSAKFVVDAAIPTHLKAGVFAAPATFDALIRFSNGGKRDDREADAHGMAIKLLNVSGRKLLDGHVDETTQDFVLTDHETFFTHDLGEFAAFARLSNAAKAGALGKAMFLSKMAIWHRAMLSRARAFVSHKPTSPLSTHYWSATPYRLGGEAVKYMAVSPEGGQAEGDGVRGENGLGEALKTRLAEREARFDFGVHVQTDPRAHPVEDETVNWSRNGAPFVKLATIVIPRQTVDPEARLAERIAFSPWHSLDAHRPLGAINRARGAIYTAMLALRHKSLGVSPVGTSEPPADLLRQSSAA